MYAACVLFLMLWSVYAWSWQSTVTGHPDFWIRIEGPLFRQNCGVKDVPCIDDCSFLCTEPDAKCIGGMCQVAPPSVACDKSKGGLPVLLKDPVPHWSCLCTDSRFYGGPACSTLNPDVCENGTFFYMGRLRHVCVCPAPFELLKIDSKPHCVAAEMMGFYDELTMSRNLF